MAEVLMTNGAVTLVDDCDLERVLAHRWFNHNGYARTRMSDGRCVLLHRFIFGLPPWRPGDMEVDHINRDRRDNRRANLRLVTRAQNFQNQDSYRGSRSRFRGVSFLKHSQRWVAAVRLDGTKHYLGCYDTEEEAGAVAAAFRREHMPFSVLDREAA